MNHLGQQRVLLVIDGMPEVIEATVYRDMRYRTLVETARNGDVGYMMRTNGDPRFRYNGKYEVWHLEGLDPARYEHVVSRQESLQR